MGYRSHVLFAVDADLDVTMRLTTPEVTEILECADRVHDFTEPMGSGYYVYEWDNIKWYDSWDSVRAIESWMSRQEDESDDPDECGFSFFRDGEELNDLEHQGSWNYDIVYGIGIDIIKPSITDDVRKAISTVLDAINGEWGKYVDEDLKAACDVLSPFRINNLSQAQENSDKIPGS